MLFACGLLHDSLCSSVHIASNGTMLSESWIQKKRKGAVIDRFETYPWMSCSSDFRQRVTIRTKETEGSVAAALSVLRVPDNWTSPALLRLGINR